MSTQPEEQINNSELTPEDKEDFIFFLENISIEEKEQIDELFSNDTSKLLPFWKELKKKLNFMDLLDNDTNLSSEAKEDIKEKISEMDNEELDAFLDSIQKIIDGGDVTTEMNSLLEKSNQNSEKLSTLTDKLISQ